MAKVKKYSATNDNLIDHALEPTMRWLIAAALDGTTITYGEIKQRLEQEAGFSTVFATRIGLVAGELMHKIQSVEPNAPLINVIVVNQTDRQPSKGAGGFMATRFGEKQLAKEGAKKKNPKLWKQTFMRAAGEVYKYSEEDWATLYKRVFGKALASTKIKSDREDRKQGVEKDGIVYGRGPEGPEHKALRLWITANPHEVHKAYVDAETETESSLDSGDRIDAVYKCSDRIVLIEVKSSISNNNDLKRGVYQCVKYRAVRAAMDVRDNPLIETYLVTETELPGEISALLKLHNIKHFQAPQNRK